LNKHETANGFADNRSKNCIHQNQASTGADSEGGANMIFWRKMVIFHTKYPKNVSRLPQQLKKYDFLA
jgi:hypothetical protein